MRIRLLLPIFAVLASSFLGTVRAQGPRGSSIAFILDCSRSMDQPAVEAEQNFKQVSDGTQISRLEAAQTLLEKMLRDLAAQGNYQVGLWLYGHRLVWEAEVKHPDLLTQDDYLEATVGFGALNGLLPGDDVELARPIKRYTALEHTALMARLNILKPWGEKPLYLTLTRALEALADQPATSAKSVIVLTDGRNEQWLARYKTTHAGVAEALRQNITPIHFICFAPSPGEEDPNQQELRDLAERGGGSLVHATAESQLTVAQVLSNSRKVDSPVATAADGEEVEERTAERPPVVAQSAERTICGSVVYYGRPVTSATVTLTDTSIPPVKTDSNGRFLLRKVPSGRQYHLFVKGIAKNSFREKSLDFGVEADTEEQPFLTIELK